jgi:hypothetical protein
MAIRRTIDLVLENRPESGPLLRPFCSWGKFAVTTWFAWEFARQIGRGLHAAFRSESPAQSCQNVRITRIKSAYRVLNSEQKGNVMNGLQRDSAYPLPPFPQKRCATVQHSRKPSISLCNRATVQHSRKHSISLCNRATVQHSDQHPKPQSPREAVGRTAATRRLALSPYRRIICG